jgi:hypothetical protein
MPLSETAYWAEWPTCSQCGRRRQTECPICGTAGNDFPLAEFLAPPEPIRGSRLAHGEQPNENTSCEPTSNAPAAEILLHCPQCDEVFHPQFYRRCAECGLDQGRGIQPPIWEPEPLPFRVTVTIFGLVGIALASMLYLWMLFAA